MKVGAENRTKLVLAVVLFTVAIILLLRMISRPSPATAKAPAQANPAAPAAKKVATRQRRASPLISSLDPRLRFDLLKATEETRYAGTGRNIFRMQEEIPEPVKNPIKEPPPAPPPDPGPPPPPPIPLKFYGFASQPGEPKRVFLSLGQGDNLDVFVAGEGDIVNRRYRLLRIGSNFVEIEDVLNNHRQSLPLTVGAAP